MYAAVFLVSGREACVEPSAYCPSIGDAVPKFLGGPNPLPYLLPFSPFRSLPLKYSQEAWESTLSSPSGVWKAIFWCILALKSDNLVAPVLLIFLRINWPQLELTNMQASYCWGQMHCGPPN